MRGTAAFIAVLVGETAVFTLWTPTDMAFLWYNVVAGGQPLINLRRQRRAAQRIYAENVCADGWTLPDMAFLWYNVVAAWW